MMLQESVGNLPVELHFLDPDPNCSCSSISERFTRGDFKDFQSVVDFGSTMDIVTVEIEHVNVAALRALKEAGVSVYPQAQILEMIQDKGLQKKFYANSGFPTAPFELLKSHEDIDPLKWRFPFVLKSRKGGYDGKGVQIVRREGDPIVIEGPVVLEQMADLEVELSVIVARNSLGDVSVFPVVEMEFDPVANLVSALVSPADIRAEIAEKAQEMAKLIIEELGLVGLLAVEFFLNKDGSIWVNEIAPRPHNSGHQTIEGNRTSQYEQHLRAISGMKLGDTSPEGVAVMVNLLGEKGHEGPRKILSKDLVDQVPNAYIHDYRKEITRPGRKMGHITVVDEDRAEALSVALKLQSQVRYVSESMD